MQELYSVQVEMEGILQGVGFRPTMQRLALSAGLGGWVQNRSGKVRLVLVGERRLIEEFLEQLPGNLPLRACLEKMSASEITPFIHPVAKGEKNSRSPLEFAIRASSRDQQARVSIPADLATCSECRSEVLSAGTRFFGYAFTTCTNCGPRYTVVDAMPYDRERTSLKRFPLCEQCTSEYTDPADRRFHAESIACPQCGPRLWLADAAGHELPSDPVPALRRALKEGAVVAVKGLGGFLLAVDPHQPDAVATLRERKHRPSKPFALMARTVEVVRRICRLTAAGERVLTSPEAPIVICNLLPDAGREGLALELLSPDTNTLGMMLPTTPLHTLMFEPLPSDPTPPFDLLVMTSGNRGGEPICTRNEEAFERLAGIADLFICHDRPINLRCDDSLCVISNEKPQLWRRARGYAPQAVFLSRPLGRQVLAMGAELKNTVAMGYESQVVLSPHVGDLSTPQAVDSLEEVATCLPEFLDRKPEVIAVDLHPDMHSTRLGQRIATDLGLPLVEVQHHHAHAAAGLAEAGLERALALVFDGTGLGSDGTIWGAELLDVGPEGFDRLATFEPVRLPGGDAAVWQPARQLLARWACGQMPAEQGLWQRFGVSEQEVSLWHLQCERGLNAPLTHAAGRLFDAFSCALAVSPQRVSYEGQAAVSLETKARECTSGIGLPELSFTLNSDGDLLLVDWSPLFASVLESAVISGDGVSGERARWAMAFHQAVARAAREMVRQGSDSPGLPVILTGGVFMNQLLLELLIPMLEEDGRDVVLPRQAPPNDGGISLGQAFVAGGLC